MIDWKLKRCWFVMALFLLALYFGLGTQQDYARMCAAYAAGLQPSWMYHNLALLSISVGTACYWRWIVAQLMAHPVD